MPIYDQLRFPPAPPDRPYTFINMVATIDGKTVSGGRDESVLDLGSKLDHETMGQLGLAADAVMLGAATMRATPVSWSPKSPIRVVVSHAGDFDFSARFFEENSFVANPSDSHFQPTERVGRLEAGEHDVDFKLLLRKLRQDLEVERLLILGGSELNAQLLRMDLVDELFLTIAPKVKLGRGVPTYAGGEPLERGQMPDFTLLENHAAGNEIYLRYRRKK